MKRLLIIDGIINLLLGILLFSFFKPVIEFLGIPYVEQQFYVKILGAVLFGIGLALIIQTRSPKMGLGLGGAIAINMCGGVCLVYLLLSQNFNIPTHGKIIIWFVATVLIGLSGVELLSIKTHKEN